MTALGGKSQVQIYAQTANGDPEPTLIIEGGEARVNGSLLLPGSVIQARAETHFGASGFITFINEGLFETGMMDIIEYETIAIDEFTTVIDHVFQPGMLSVELLSSSGFNETWYVDVFIRLLKNGSVIWPSPSSTNGHWASETELRGESVSAVIFPSDYFQALEFEPASGSATYKWQVNIGVETSQDDEDDIGSNWSFVGSQSRMLIPRNEI